MQAAAKSVRVFIVVQTFKQEQVFLKEKVSANERQTHCPLWVKSGHSRHKSCPLCPRKRTLIAGSRMSALCQKRTLLVLFDHLVGTIEQRRKHREAERSGGFQIDNEFKLRGLLSRQI